MGTEKQHTEAKSGSDIEQKIPAVQPCRDDRALYIRKKYIDKAFLAPPVATGAEAVRFPGN